MKRFLVSVFLLLLISIKGFSVNRTWSGGAAGNWGTATNWTPNGIPTASDDLTINTNSTIIIDVSPVLSSLLITGNVTVVFTITNSTTTSLTRIITPASSSSLTKGFQLNTGSTLTIETNIQSTGSANLSLRFNSGVYGQIDGTLIFNGTVSGTGNLLTTLALITGAIVQVNGKIQLYDASANISGSTPANLIFNSGSSMEILKNAGSFPDATWHLNSLAKVYNAIGISPPIFNGTNYGNLEWNCPSQTNNLTNYFNDDISFNNVNFISTNGANANGEMKIKTGASVGVSTITINGDLTIGTNARLVIASGTVTSGNGGRLVLKGNLNNQGTITTVGGAGTTNDFELNGTSDQSISNTGTISGAKTVTIPGLTFIMNSAGATLNSPLTLPANLTLLEGNIKTTSTNILTMIRNASYSTDLNHGFIEGPMKKIGDEDFTFPIGIGNIYAPITFNNEVGSPTSTTDVFEAEYIRANPQSFVGNNYGPSAGINHVSYIEYWRLQETSGAGARSKDIALTVNAGSFCRVINSTFISRYSGSGWTNEGGIVLGTTGSAGIYQTGTLRAANNVSSFGYFTLATALDFTLNPLPIKLISFNAIKINDRKAMLTWELAECCSSAAKFEIERAGDNRRFSIIAKTDGNETNRFYTIPDNDLKAGVNYYRLKMTDADGALTYSRIVAVLNGIKGLLLTMSPTIVTNDVSLTVTSAEPQQLDLLVVDMLGKTVKKLSQKVMAGNTSIALSLVALQSGTYQLFGITGEGKTNLVRFIKQ